MIRKIRREDRELFLKLTREFYNTDAVSHPIPYEFHERTFDELMRSDDYMEVFILEYNNEPAGYCMIVKTYSQEAGGMVTWIEELYIQKKYRSRGLGKELFKYLEETKDDTVARLRLEVEADNNIAKNLYTKMGFKELEYQQMIKEFKIPQSNHLA